MKFQECFTRAAVLSWSDAKCRAWAGRKQNPNEFLYRFPPPWQQQATGAFTAAELLQLEQRAAEFKRRGWPLSSWGLLSLGVPGRVGYQCAAALRKLQGGEAERTTPAQSAACLAHHSAQLEQLWSDLAVQRLSAQVDAWLQERQQLASAAPPSQPQQERQQQQQQQQPQLRVPARAASGQWSDSDSDFEAAPARVGGANSGAVGVAKQTGVAGAAADPLPAPPSSHQAPLPRPRPLGLANPGAQAVQPSKQPTAPKQPAPKEQQQQQGLRGSVPAGQGPGSRGITAGLGAGPQRARPPQAGRGAALTGQLRGTAASKPKRPVPAASDDEDDFVAGSLRQAPCAPLASFASASPAAVPAGKPGAKPSAKSGGAKRKKQWRQGELVLTTGEDGGAAAAVYGEDVVSLKLAADSLPGWAPRPVAGYASAQQPLPADAPADRRVVTTDDISTFDLASLGGGFLGVLINLPLTAAPPAQPPADAAAGAAGSGAAAGEQPASAGDAAVGSASIRPAAAAAAAAAAATAGVTPTQLAALRIDDSVVAAGIICVWAEKEMLAPVVQAMAGWGAEYVENLTWLQLGPNANVLQEPAALLRRSHSTLLMGRKGPPSSLELRHQRTPDVVITPALPPGQTPVEAYSMLETLLPGARAGAGDRPRLLEICAATGDPAQLHGRAGWVTLVQAAR